MTSGEQLPLAGNESEATTESLTPKDALARLAKVTRRLDAVNSARLSDPDAVEKLEADLAALGGLEEFGAAIARALGDVQEALVASRSSQVAGFNRSLAAFVNEARESGNTVRESSAGWRVGKFDLETDGHKGKVRILYNGEEVIPSRAISSGEDIRKLESSANKKLESSEIPLDQLERAISQAYRHVLRERMAGGKGTPKSVPILDFYRELRPALIRVQLSGKKPDSRVNLTELPKWQFMYNVDRYRQAQGREVERAAIRLITGSQQESSRGLSMKFGGLTEGENPKEFCHIEVVEPGSKA